jgi:hypothetical protein
MLTPLPPPPVPEAKTLEEARLQARVWGRARSLPDEGYSATFLTEDVLEISGPNGGPYRIDTMARTCDCPFFAEHGFCKHWWGWPHLW